MYPPKVDDEAIRRTIHELTREGQPPSGAALREALKSRYGSRGGVSRIYRLLAQVTGAASTAVHGPITARLLEQEVINLRELLRQTRIREDAAQAYWQRQITQVSERVQRLEPLVNQAASSGQVTDGLRAEVKAAETRTGQLEVMIRAFGPATGRSGSS